MSAKTETLAAIITEMRRRSQEAYEGQTGYPECWRNQIDYDEIDDWIDRIEAAVKREKQHGNAAALRRALRHAVNDHWFNMTPELRNEIRAALDAPPRNCDVGTADEQAERFEAECKRRDLCTPCPVHAAWGEFREGKPKSCQLIWAQMPFAPEKGGAK